MLQSLEFKLDLLAPRLPADDQVKSAQSLLESWKKQSHSLRLSLRKANLQAKANIRKAAQDERKLLLGGGEESTARRRKSSEKGWDDICTAESITEILRRTRQLMVQEAERSSNTLMTSDESTGVLRRKAESEYKGFRSLLMRTRNLLSIMQRHDVIDRLQRTVIAALKAGMAGKGDFRCEAVEEGIKNHARIPQNAYPQRQSPLRQACTMNFRIPRGTNFFLHLYFFPGL